MAASSAARHVQAPQRLQDGLGGSVGLVVVRFAVEGETLDNRSLLLEFDPANASPGHDEKDRG